MSNGELRQLAEKRGLLVGGCFTPDAFEQDPDYGKNFAIERNALVAENIMKPRFLMPEQDVYDFDKADQMMAFAEANGMNVRGHTLTWHGGVPGWLRKAPFSRSEALAFLKSYVLTVVKRYQGKIFAWDVINELLDGTGILRENNPWIRSIGPDYAEYAFKWAHQADPDCLLFYNDYDMDVVNDKSTYCRRWLKSLLDKGVPIHGVGLQAHLSVDDVDMVDGMAENIRLFNEMGLTVHITELDVRMPTDATEQDLQRQADIYRKVFETALKAKDCSAIMLWGFSDNYSWIPGWKKGECDHAMILNRNYAPKPAYHAICDALKTTR